MAWDELPHTEEIVRLVRSGNLEDAAFAVSQKPNSEIEAVVRAIVSHIIQSPPTERQDETELLAWLLNYHVIDPVLLLQVLVVTREYSVLNICGTSHFGEDKMRQFKLSQYPGKPLKHAVDTDRETLSVNFKEYLLASRKRPSQPPAKDVKHVKPAKLLKPDNVPESNEYTQQIRRLLLSSMSASEAVFRVTKAFKRGSELPVAATILKTCYESVTYNQLFGRVAALLSEENTASWQSAFTGLFKQFVISDECDDLDVDELRVCGAFFAHLLSSDVISWKAFSVIELDEDPKHASLRILVMAILEDLKMTLGPESVEKKILDPEIEDHVGGMLRTPLAPWFWEVAGFVNIATKLHSSYDIGAH